MLSLRAFPFLFLGTAALSVDETASSQCSYTRPPGLAGTTKAPRADGVNGWHPRKIDYREFCVVNVLQKDRMLVVTHSDFDTPVVIKLATDDLGGLDRLSLDHEVSIYRRLQGKGITPLFLGHVMDDHRHSVGFIMEYIQPVRAARSGQSYTSCLQALSVLHQHGIAHGDAHDGNCLLREDGSAVLVDFELSEEAEIATRQDDLAAEFERDLDIMSRCIRAARGE